MRVRCVLFVLLVTVWSNLSAQSTPPKIYTYLCEWALSAEEAKAFAASWQGTYVPILRRLHAEGVIVGWGSFAKAIHEPAGTTHGVWWTGPSLASVEAVRLQLPGHAINGSSEMHRDHLLLSLFRKSRPLSGEGGYLSIAVNQVAPGKERDWHDAWRTLKKSMFDELVDSGAIVFYDVAVEHIHTEDPGFRYEFVLTESAVAEDKGLAAGEAVEARLASEQRSAALRTYRGAVIPSAHRDVFSYVLTYQVK